MSEPPWDNSCRLEADKCVAARRDRANRYAAGYSLTNLRPGPGTGPQQQQQQQQHHHLLHRSMRKWDGYGWSSAAVDGDTELRLEARATHPRTRMQLNARVFCAVPGLSRASADPEVESRLVLGSAADTSQTRYAPIGEVDFDRFDPGVSPVPVDHIVPVWTVGGDSSRDIARSKKFRRAVRRFDCAAPAAPSSPPQLAPVAAPAPLRDGRCETKSWHRLVDAAAPSRTAVR